MSRRSRNIENHAAEFVSRTLKDKIDELMTNRWKLMCPFPIPAIDLWRLCWTDKQHAAFETLNGTMTLRKHRQFRIVGLVDGDGDTYKIRITMDDDQPMPQDFVMSCNLLTDEMRLKIDQWVPQWLRYLEEKDALLSKVHNLSDQCSTYGQVYRLWPDLLGFFGDIGKEKIARAKVQSPYPERVLKWVPDPDNDWYRVKGKELEDEFKPAAFEPFTSMIAECLMLPVIDDLIHVGVIEY